MEHLSNMIRLAPFLGLILLSSSARECSNDEFTRHSGHIIAFDVATEIRAGERVEINVTYEGGNNGCAVADHLETSFENDTLFIDAWYRVPKEEQVCAMVMPVHQLIHEFTPNRSGAFVVSNLDRSVTRSFTLIEAPVE